VTGEAAASEREPAVRTGAIVPTPFAIVMVVLSPVSTDQLAVVEVI
jgi:hypothetical protein